MGNQVKLLIFYGGGYQRGQGFGYTSRKCKFDSYPPHKINKKSLGISIKISYIWYRVDQTRSIKIEIKNKVLIWIIEFKLLPLKQQQYGLFV